MAQTVPVGPSTGGIGQYLLTFFTKRFSTLLGNAGVADNSPPAVSVSNSIMAREPLALINGNVTVTPPAGAIGFILTPPAGSTVTKTIKGLSGDTGLGIHPEAPFVWFFPLAGAPTNFVITANGIETCTVEFP